MTRVLVHACKLRDLNLPRNPERDDIRQDCQDGGDFGAWQGARKAAMQRIAAPSFFGSRRRQAPKATPPGAKSDAAMRRKQHRPARVAQRAIMVMIPDVITL